VAKLDPSQITEEARHLGRLGPRVVRWAGAVGVLALTGGVLLGLAAGDGMERFFSSYLVSYCFFLSLSLGALFFVALQHVTHSGWSVVVRRLAEVISADLLLLAVLGVPLVAGAPVLYEWLAPGPTAPDALLRHKQPYLNWPFFVARCVGYAVLWCGMAYSFLSRSLRQDETGEVGLTTRMERLSGPALAVYAVTVTFAAFDLIMSLEADWFSTILGVYFFAGCVIGFVALMALVAMGLQRSGRLARAITIEHYHDLGKLLLAFTCFWAYVAFSQYLLIWYANIPEETVWYLRRQQGSWGWVGLVLVFGHFALPFMGLISRRAKRSKRALAFWSVWLLGMHWVDLYWLIEPRLSPGRVPLGLLDGLCFVGLGGLFVAGLAKVAGDRSLLAVKDPRLAESLAFENA
jgi:hypothetical protein